MKHITIIIVLLLSLFLVWTTAYYDQEYYDMMDARAWEDAQNNLHDIQDSYIQLYPEEERAIREHWYEWQDQVLPHLEWQELDFNISTTPSDQYLGNVNMEQFNTIIADFDSNNTNSSYTSTTCPDGYSLKNNMCYTCPSWYFVSNDLTCQIKKTYSEELKSAYKYAYSLGITTQWTIDDADMNWSLLRSHMAKMIVRYAKQVLWRTNDPNDFQICGFNDIYKETNELQDYIIEACELWLMGINITSFNPNGKVTRAEFGTVLSRALWGNVNDTNNKPYYERHLNALKQVSVMKDISNPSMNEIRWYVMLMLQRSSANK